MVSPSLCKPIATKVEMKNKKPKTENREIITISLVLNFASEAPVVAAAVVAGPVVVSSVVNSVVVGLLVVISPFSSPGSSPLPKEFKSSVKVSATNNECH